MKELVIAYTPAANKRKASVAVRYRAGDTAQFQEASVPFVFAVTDTQRELMQWYLESYLLFPWGEFNTRAKTAEATMRELGIALFNAIFAARSTNALYANISNDLPNTRITIQAGDPIGIALPWELLYDSDKGEYGDIARLAYAFARNQANLYLQPPPAPTEGATFNILMVICRPGGPEGDVPFQSVARPLLELFRPHRDRIRLDILRPPTFEQLARVLNDKPNFYHVVHFDGHGAFPHGGAAQGMLSFESESGDTRYVTGAELGSLLAGKGVPMILLNACQSGMTHPEAIYPSVGNELLKAGTRGVVAMAYSVYVQSAVRFMRRLYEGLVNGEELARAVALGRDELRSHPHRQSPIGDVPLQDWVVPVLFEADRVRLTTEPLRGLRLNQSLLQDKQVTAGAEINCPPPPDFGFIGRDGVILELERAFQKETVVLLQGMAGVGKTETAMGLARWRAETGALNGPIFFHSFEHHTPLAHVCDRVGQAFQQAIKQQLGVEWHLLDAEKRRELALAVLKQVPCLLIWDNFEPVHGFPTGTPSVWTNEEQQELRRFLSDLRGGETKVLLTSRRDESGLGNLYRRVEMSGLKLSEAQELAVRVLERAGLNAPAIKKLDNYTDLLRYLQGNPLAIQVILPELKNTKPDALLQSLQTGTTTLPRDDTKQGREHSLAASLTYRLDQLDPMLRQQLGILSLFQAYAGTIFLATISSLPDAPEFIKSVDNDGWIKKLDQLTELGLLRHAAPGYFSIHPALSWFFRSVLQTLSPEHLAWLEQAFIIRYAEYGRYLFLLFETSSQLALRVLSFEEDNLKYALKLARQSSMWLEVEGILYGLQRLFVTQGRWVEWERLVALVASESLTKEENSLQVDNKLWLMIQGLLAEIANFRGDHVRQRTILLLMKHNLEKIGDERNLFITLGRLGDVARQTRNFDEAEQWYQQSLAGIRLVDDKPNEVATLHNLGTLAQERRHFDQAREYYTNALYILDQTGGEHRRVSTLANLATIAREQQDYSSALRWAQQSLEIANRLGDVQGKAHAFSLMGLITRDDQQFGKAEQFFQAALHASEIIGDSYSQATILHQLGELAFLTRRFSEAQRWYHHAASLFEQTSDKHGLAACLFELGRLAHTLNDKPKATHYYEDAEKLLVELNDDYHLENVRQALQLVRGG